MTKEEDVDPLIQGFRELHLRPDEIVRAAAGEIAPAHLDACSRCRDEVSLIAQVNADLERAARPRRIAWLVAAAAAAVIAVAVGLYPRGSQRLPAGVPQSAASATPAAVAPARIRMDKAPTDFLAAEMLVLRGARDRRRAFLDALAVALDPYRRDDFAGAEERLGPLAAEFPEAPEIAYYLGVCLLLEDRPAEAVEPLRAATRAKEMSASGEARVYLAVAQYNAGDRAAGLTGLRQLCPDPLESTSRACAALRQTAANSPR